MGNMNESKTTEKSRKFSSYEVWPGGQAGFTFGWQTYGLEKQTRRLPWDFTCTDFIKNLVPSKAFTMAEILISLTIIGIIAAITLPALQANINEKTWITQRKALYSRMSQAISMMPSLNGYGEFVTHDENGENGKDTVAMTFVTNGLGKVLELKNICDNAHLKDCGLPDKIKAVDGTTFSTKSDETNPLTTLTELNIKFHGSWTNTDGSYTYTFNGGNIDDFAAAGFETKNGESVIAFYNPYCVDYEVAKTATNDYVNGFVVHPQRFMCANFVFDLNGKKGPNTAGKDIGVMSVLYPTDSEVVMPLPSGKIFQLKFTDTNGVHPASNKCKSLGDYRLPTREEGMSLFYNEDLITNYKTISANNNYWTNERYEDSGAYVIRLEVATYHAFPVDTSAQVMCVKR